MKTLREKGELAELKVLIDLTTRGYDVSIPFGTCRYDLIVDREGKLERIQVKYCESDGKVINVRCRCVRHNKTRNVSHRYLPSEIDWIATYDKTSDSVYYIESKILGIKGRTDISLRLVPGAYQIRSKSKEPRWAEDFKDI